MWRLIKNAASSRAGQALCLLNLGLVGYFYFSCMSVPGAHLTLKLFHVGNGGFIAGRLVDFDSSLFFVLLLLHTLPVIFSNVLTDLVIAFFPGLDVLIASWVYAGLLLTLLSIQWLIIGGFIEKMVKLYRDSRSARPHLTRG